MSDPPLHARPRRRVLKLVLATIATIIVVVVALAAFVLAHLETPSVKTRLQLLVRKATGIELDYADAHASLLSGAHLHDIRVKTGGTLRAIAPEVVRIGSLDVSWGLGRLAQASVEGVTVQDVDVTVVLDDDGRTSFDFHPPEPTKAVVDKAVERRSRSIAGLLETAVPLHGAHVGPIRLTVVKTRDGVPYDRVQLSGLSLDGRHDGNKTTLSLGQRAAPLTLALDERGDRRTLALEPRLWLEAVVQGTQLQISVDLHAGRQQLVAGVDRALALDLLVRAEPAKGQLDVSITRGELADGTATLRGELELPDDGDDGKPLRPLVLHSADGQVDADKLLSLVPRALLPKAFLQELPRIKQGALALHADQLALTPAPHVLEGGQVSLRAELEGVHAALPGADVALPKLRLDVRSGANRLIDATIDAHLESLRYAQGKTRASIDGARLEVTGKGLDLDPQHRAGALTASLHATTVGAVTGGATIALSGVVLDAKGALPSAPPYGGSVVLGVDHATVTQGRRRLVDDRLGAHLAVDDVRPDGQRAHVKGDVSLGALEVGLEAKKAGPVLDYDVDVKAPTLALLSPFVAGIDAPWASMGLSLRSKGRVDSHGRLPSIEHETHLEVDRFGLRAPAGAFSAKVLALDLASRGTTKLHEGSLTVAFTGLHRDGSSFGDGKITGSLKLDATAPRLTLQLGSTGSATPGIDARAELGFDRKARRVSFDVDLKLKRLGLLGLVVGKLGRQLDLDKLEVDLATKGELAGLVDDLSLDGKVRFAKDPLLAVGTAKLGLHVRALDWRLGDEALASPKLTWDGELRAVHDKRTLEGDLSIEGVRGAFGVTRIGVTHIGDHLQVEVDGDPRKLQLTLEDSVKVRGLSQSLSGAYALQDLELDVKATGTKDGVIRVPLFRFRNDAAGTTIDLRGGLDLSEDRRSLALRGSLKQDLATLWKDRSLFVGSGLVETDVAIHSGDLRRFRAETSLRVQGVSVELPRQKIKVTGVDGEIPVTADVIIDRGARLVHLAHDNSYSELRFVDQHPMFSQHSYLTIARVDTPWISFAPFAGNLEVQDNILSLSQLELGVRGGRVTGRAEVQLAGLDTKAELNLRASNVHSARGEPFDGNTALEVSVRQRSVDGRGEILRIGRRHLLELLDIVDPTRSDPSVNKVRRVLAIAYPDRVRLEFKRGFASANFKFGGLGRLIKLDPIRGITMGPIIDRALDPMLKDDKDERK